MTDMTSYIENFFKDTPYDDILLQFERLLIDEWNETVSRVKKAGLKDDAVLGDLFLSAHTDLKAEYAEYRRAELKKRREKAMHKFLLWGTPIYYLIMVAVYLAVSFTTQNWRQSWLIVIGFVTLWVDTAGVLLVTEIASKRPIFHPIARVILGLSVMMTATLVYLIGLMLFRIPHFWVVFPAGVFVMYCVDAIFAKKTGQKMSIIN